MPSDGGRCPEDCVALPKLDEAALLDNICERYVRRDIYTYVAQVLLAVNPYQDVPGMYGETAMKQYIGRPRPGARPPPHPYAVAAAALRGLRRGESQAVVISGESGAGKTETAKIILGFLRANSSAGAGAGAVAPATSCRAENDALAMGRVLESFGNARTTRNANSSRFGKQLRLRLRPGCEGELVAQTTTYLLEASRVAGRPSCERSFHVFYDLLAGLSSDARQRLGVHGSPSAHALTRADAPSSGGVTAEAAERRRDEDRFGELTRALAGLGLGGDLEVIFEILAGILHLGEAFPRAEGAVEAAGSSAAAPVEVVEGSLTWAAKLLGFDPDQLRRKLTKRSWSIKGRKSVHESDRTRVQAEFIQRSLMITIYKGLFRRLVQRMNQALDAGGCGEAAGAAAAGAAPAELALLDIYGFESLERNALEQLLINLTNERLQELFSERCLMSEQALYQQEGLSFRKVELEDRSGVVQAIHGVLDILDESGTLRLQGMKDTTDDNFCDKILNTIGRGGSGSSAGGPKYIRPARHRSRGNLRLGGGSRSDVLAPAFVVAHYASEVEYSRQGWIDRNDARSIKEVEELLAGSDKAFVQTFAEQDVRGAGARAPARGLGSVSKQHRRDLDDLLRTLKAAPCVHFVRCFRPNMTQHPCHVDKPYLLEQLRSCGTIQLLQLMHQGYPNRVELKELAERFGPLLPRGLRGGSPRTLAHSLMLALGVPKEEWTLGVTRIFLKAGQLSALEDLKAGGASLDPQRVASATRAIVRCRWRRAAKAAACAAWLARHARQVRRQRIRRRFRAALVAIRFVAYARRLAGENREVRLAALQARRARLRRRFRAAAQAAFLVACLARLAREARRRRAREAAAAALAAEASAAAAPAAAQRGAEEATGAAELAAAEEEEAAVDMEHALALPESEAEQVALPAKSPRRAAPSPHRRTVPSPARVPSAAAQQHGGASMSLFASWDEHGLATTPADPESLASIRRWQEVRPRAVQKRSWPTEMEQAEELPSAAAAAAPTIVLQQPGKRRRLC